jgi:hypothetical protein
MPGDFIVLYNGYHVSDASNYVMFDEFAVDDSFIGPSEGFLGGTYPDPEPQLQPEPESEPEPEPEPEPVMPIFSSDMEGGSPTGDWMDARTAESNGGATITFPSDGGSQVARFNYRAGCSNAVWLRQNFGSSGTVNNPPVDELWINPDNNRRTFQVGLQAIQNGSDHVFGLEWAQTDRKTGAWLNGAWLGDFATTSIPENRKLYLQLHIRNSTNDQANGLVQLFNSGKLIAGRRNVAINDSFGDHPDHFLLTSQISDSNGVSNGYTQYDNVALYDIDPGPFRAP